jgi:hypothetical protein
MEELFKGKNLSQITPLVIETWKQIRKEQAPVAFNRELGTLKTMLVRSALEAKRQVINRNGARAADGELSRRGVLMVTIPVARRT